MQQKIQKIFFHFQIVAFEFVTLTLAFTKREYSSLGVNMLINSLKI